MRTGSLSARMTRKTWDLAPFWDRAELRVCEVEPDNKEDGGGNDVRDNEDEDGTDGDEGRVTTRTGARTARRG